MARIARIARIVAPGMPDHITQRGNRRLQTFFSDKDYIAYIVPERKYFYHEKTTT